MNREKAKEEAAELMLNPGYPRWEIVKIWADSLKKNKPLTPYAKVWGDILIVAREALDEEK